MSKYYYVSTAAQSNGDHEVHSGDCNWLPKSENRIPLGTFSHCLDAVAAAKKHYAQVNGCKFCSNACHTQ